MSLDIFLGRRHICPNCGHQYGLDGGYVHEQNITHNLGAMAVEAGIYELLWRPEENGIKSAQQLIEPLKKATTEMRTDPARFKKHDASNGWETYEDFLPWLDRLLDACEANPGSIVVVSR